ncbi:hypothetical protein PDN20_29890 [Bacillus cereus]|nr:hypothetical protein [Bacillus cereus]MDA2130430.1 hypothetical protein [Bacillus cereus]MDA2152782.1 hypothetical protein [Bacillus cereus]
MIKIQAHNSFNLSIMEAQLKQARKAAVEAARKPFANEAKRITADEDHVDSSRYINSISERTDFPAVNKTGRGKISPSDGDIVNVLKETRDTTELETGTAVDYAHFVERRYNIIARGLDNAEPDMQDAASKEIIKIITK